MFEWLAEHRALAIAVVVIACLAVGLAEYRVMRERTLAVTTWLFGLIVLCVYVGGSPQLGAAAIGVAAVLFIAGAMAIFLLTRGPPRR